MDYIIVKCPHCNDEVILFKNEINCKIYRHGVYKENLKQIDPHMDKEGCDHLANNNLIYGCGKPFKLVDDIAIPCDYTE